MRIIGYHKSAPYICTPLVPIFLDDNDDEKLFVALHDEDGKIMSFKLVAGIDTNKLITAPEKPEVVYDLGSEYRFGFQYNKDQTAFGNKRTILKNLMNSVKLKNIDDLPFISLEIAIMMANKKLVNEHTLACWKILQGIDEEFARNWLNYTGIPVQFRSDIDREIGKKSNFPRTSFPISGPFFLMDFLSKASQELGHSSRSDLIRAALFSFIHTKHFFEDNIIKEIDRFSSEIQHYADANLEHALHAVAFRQINQNILVDASMIADRGTLRKIISEKIISSQDLLIKSTIEANLERIADAVMLISLVYATSKIGDKFSVSEFSIDRIETVVRSEIGGLRV